MLHDKIIKGYGITQGVVYIIYDTMSAIIPMHYRSESKCCVIYDAFISIVSS